MSQAPVGVLSVLAAAEQLKKVPRVGWITEAGIEHPESVADHSYAVALISMVIADYYNLDGCKMIKMALLHDLCESLTGDIQPGDTTYKKKHETERRALSVILKSLPLNLSKEYLALFDEFNQNESKEAKFVHQLDKVEMAAQAVEYSKTIKRDLGGFFNKADKETTEPNLKSILHALISK